MKHWNQWDWDKVKVVAMLVAFVVFFLFGIYILFGPGWERFSRSLVGIALLAALLVFGFALHWVAVKIEDILTVYRDHLRQGDHTNDNDIVTRQEHLRIKHQIMRRTDDLYTEDLSATEIRLIAKHACVPIRKVNVWLDWWEGLRGVIDHHRQEDET